MLLDQRPPRRRPAAPWSARASARCWAAPRPPRACSAALAVVSLPFDVAAHERAVDVGLSTQDLGAWLGDWAKANGISAAIAAGVGTGLLALIRRSPRRWWIPGSAGAGRAWRGLFTWLAPVVLAPVFNEFEELPPGQARSDVLELGERADVEIGEVYSVDASRRSTALNAYVGGLGPTKRVVLYDTLLDEADRGERRSVVAHELGHVHGNDIPRGLLFVAIVGAARAAVRGRALARRSGAARAPSPGSPPRCRRWRSPSRSPRSRSAWSATSSRARSRRGPTPSRSS